MLYFTIIMSILFSVGLIDLTVNHSTFNLFYERTRFLYILMGCFYRLWVADYIMAHCTGKLCPFEEQGKFINVKKVPESLQVCSIFRNTVRCWRKNVPILSLCLSPIPSPFFHCSFTAMLSPFFNCFFLLFLFMLSPPLFFILCLSRSLSLCLFSALQLFAYRMNAPVTSATTEDTCLLGHPDWLKFQRVQCRWVGGGLTGGSATDSTKTVLKCWGSTTWVQANFWSGLQHFFSSRDTVITVILVNVSLW